MNRKWAASWTGCIKAGNVTDMYLKAQLAGPCCQSRWLCHSCRPALVTPPASCQHSAIIRAASVWLQHAWEPVTISTESLCHTVCGLCAKEQVHRWKFLFFFLAWPKQKLPNSRRGRMTHLFILCAAVNCDDSLEEKKKLSRGGDLHGEEERMRGGKKNERKGSAAQVLVSISGLFI